MSDDLSEYLRAKEPGKAELAGLWRAAIGLQKVDGLTPSQFLFDTAKDHIEGRITQNQARRRIHDYYAAQAEEARPDPETEEADKVSERIVAVLNDGGFAFTPEYFISIHAKLFKGVLPSAGKLRTVNIRKREWVLKDDSVTYGDAATIKQSLIRDFIDEREFDYGGKTPRKIIPHFARFIAQIWQVHPFGEGNTRTTAVFFIKYLRTLGFDVTNDIFAENAWYFRNALVRANYNNYISGIRETTEYLERFLRNLLLGERNELRNRDMHISGVLEKQDIEPEKQDIQTQKQDIGMPDGVKPKTKAHIGKLFADFGHDAVFGRTDVMRILGLTASSASELLKKMLQLGLTEAVTGRGKGKYVFRKR